MRISAHRASESRSDSGTVRSVDNPKFITLSKFRCVALTVSELRRREHELFSSCDRGSFTVACGSLGVVLLASLHSATAVHLEPTQPQLDTLLERRLWHVVTQPGFGSCVVKTLRCTLYHSSTLDAYERRERWSYWLLIQ